MAGERAFEWDEAKAEANLVKYGVPFVYAARVFLDPRMVDIDASRTSDREARRKAIGLVEGRLFVVVHTDRDGVRRLISARRTNLNEERAYGPV
jgi:uncharacterized DUF497 family protein